MEITHYTVKDYSSKLKIRVHVYRIFQVESAHTIPSSQGWAPNICQSFASLLNVVNNIYHVLSTTYNFDTEFYIVLNYIFYNYGLLSLMTYDGLCHLWYIITLAFLAFVTYGAVSLWLSITYCPLICMPLLGSP